MTIKQLKEFLATLKRLRVRAFKDGKLEVVFFSPTRKTKKDIVIQAIGEPIYKSDEDEDWGE